MFHSAKKKEKFAQKVFRFTKEVAIACSTDRFAK